MTCYTVECSGCGLTFPFVDPNSRPVDCLVCGAALSEAIPDDIPVVESKERPLEESAARKEAKPPVSKRGGRKTSGSLVSGGAQEAVVDSKSERTTLENAMLRIHESASQAVNVDEFFAKLESNNRGENEFLVHLQTIFGLSGRNAATDSFRWLIGVVNEHGTEVDLSVMRMVLEYVRSLKPQNAVESMLASQMIATHQVAMKSMYRATMTTDPDLFDLRMSRGVKFMRVYMRQVHLLAQLRGEIKSQKIVVERVDVRDGGQAAIGVITPGAQEGDSNS